MFWYLKVLKDYAVFSGRASRAEYWYFQLISTLVTLALMLADGALGILSDELGLGVLSGIYTLAVLLPSIAVAVRRLHDINRSGKWLLLYLVPIVGAITLFVYSVRKGTASANLYGPSPWAGGRVSSPRMAGV